MRNNAAKQRLMAGKPAIGVVACAGSPLVAEMLSLIGYDFVIVDNQHGAWDENASMVAFHQIVLGAATPMARVRQNDFYAIGRLLDRGALGIVVPMVNSPQEAEAAAFAAHYPPCGGRSAGAFGAALHGAGDYMAWVEDQVYLAVQIETAEGLERADEILSVPGVDGCWIGPIDLAKSLGLDLTSQSGRQRHEAAIMRVLEACRRAGKVPGIFGGADPGYWLDKGFLFVTTAPELDILGDTMRTMLAGIRAGRAW